jgi:tetratricopeptide (TPR) repeat protein
LDHRKEWRAAERLLKQGDVAAALQQLRKVTAASDEDVQTLNRLGDLLAREGRQAEAIKYYLQIAETFERGGFAPKAIAIHKKILRLDPNHLESALRLGALYTRQQMHGEARKYLLHAANRCLESGNAARAREVFERLVEAEPDDPRHRVRLAEARVAEGDTAAAVEDLADVGELLLGQGQAQEAEAVFERAHELDAEAAAPLVGLARCREGAGRAAQAIEALEALVRGRSASAVAAVELARLYEAAGRSCEAIELIEKAAMSEVPPAAWRRLLAVAIERGTEGELWRALDRKLVEAVDPAARSGMVEMLEALAAVEADGHVPALERLAVVHESEGHVQAAVHTLDALARAYRARSDEASALQALARIRRVAPPDEEPCIGPGVARDVARNEEPDVEATSFAEAPLAAPDRPPEDPEAPAVPLSRADEEFVSGRVTQAEVLEKYDLVPQALEQLREVVERFPGHVGSQERRVAILRGEGNAAELARALCDLALARRAAGDNVGARDAAREAGALPGLGEASRRVLERLSLVEPLAGLHEAEGAPSPVVPRPGARAVPPPPTPRRTGGSETVIDLDADEPSDAAAWEEDAQAAPAGLRGGVTAPDDPGSADDDLTMIQAALERELRAADADPHAAAEAADQSVAEVLRAFRERVEEEVGADPRMHYDLGIGYKEMGLLDEAIEEFGKAVQKDDLRLEACVMLAACHRERHEVGTAVEWYKAALEGEPPESGLAQGLRYDLAETLLESGDVASALQEFRDLLEIAPSFRDVQGRVSELERTLQS